MYKVLIVDDEQLIRSGMIARFQYLNFKFERIREMGGRFRGITAQNLPALCHDPGACPALVCEFVDTAGAIWALSGPWLQPVDHSATITADI